MLTFVSMTSINTFITFKLGQYPIPAFFLLQQIPNCAIIFVAKHYQ